MGVDDVETSIGQLQREDVVDGKGEVGQTRLLGPGAGAGHDVRRGVHPEHPARRHPAGQVDGDRARSAPDVEQVHAGPKRAEEVAGRPFGRAPLVTAQHRLVVTVGVHRSLTVRHIRHIVSMCLQRASGL